MTLYYSKEYTHTIDSAFSIYIILETQLQFVRDVCVLEVLVDVGVWCHAMVESDGREVGSSEYAVQKEMWRKRRERGLLNYSPVPDFIQRNLNPQILLCSPLNPV